MKSKYNALILVLLASAPAIAQEMDDMYFNAKDRLAQTETNQASMASRYAQYDQQAVKSNPVNPSDTYTGRGLNPEYNAQQKNGAELTQENPDYFLSSYAPKDVNPNLYSGNASNYTNCSCANSYGNGGGFGNPYNNLYSPYGSYMGMGYGMGYSAFSMGMSYGMGSLYGYPGMYNPYGYGSGSVVVVNAGPELANVSGKRPTRSTSGSGSSYTRPAAVTAGSTDRSRITSTSASGRYYDPAWKSNPNNFTTRTYNYGGRNGIYPAGTSGTSGRSWATQPSRTRNTFDSFGPGFGSTSPTRGTSGVSVGGRSTSGGSTGGHSRGRN